MTRDGGDEAFDAVIVIPVYNEASTVRAVIESVRRYFSGRVIIVDDGSTDGTADRLDGLKGVEVLRFDSNCGYGCALIRGFARARELSFERVVTMDCDGQHEPAHIPEFLGALTPAVDIVSGSRYLPRSVSTGVAPAARREVNRQVTEEINRVTGWGLTDAFCGFKAYQRHSLDRLRLAETGYGMPMELWAEAWRNGLGVREIAVERIYNDSDRSFGADLDDPERRLGYYLDVWQRALKGSEA